jgi:cytochrome c-type biogenesis protein CcmE
MTRKRRRLILLLVCGVCLGSATALVLLAFNDNLVFFVTPSDLAAKAPRGRTVRLGGLVEAGSVQHIQENGKPAVRFKVTDGSIAVPVEYVGLLPDLFREGQGVVAIGAYDPAGVFVARQILAKHDEKYMPPELAAALRKQGEWRGDGQTPAYAQ